MSIPVELASERKIRDRNKVYYRFNHWPIWIFVFFIAPGPLTFDLFERGFDNRLIAWLGLLGTLPRVMPSTKGEGHERRYFYGTVWAVTIAQPVLWILWRVVPRTRAGDSFKLLVFIGVIAFVGNLARLGRLPRTRPIV